MTDDPTADKLSRFTPAPPGLDRDELMFRAGRASARTPRRWKLAAVGLAGSNLVCLALLLRTPAPAIAVPPPPLAEPPAVPLLPPPSPPRPPEPGSYLALMAALRDGELPPPTGPAFAAASTGPPLTAGSWSRLRFD